MKIAFNPSTVEALIAPPNNKDITFDLRGHNIFARGVKFCGTDTWRDIKINNVSIDSNILDLRNGSNTTLTNTDGVVTINSTWRPVVDNLTSDSTTSSLSANLGRVLKALIDGKSDSGHTHDDRYLRLTGGTMSGLISSSYSVGTWIGGCTNAILKATADGYNSLVCAPIKSGNISISAWTAEDNLNFGYAKKGKTENSFDTRMYWDAPNNNLHAAAFTGHLYGTADNAINAVNSDTTDGVHITWAGELTSTNHLVAWEANGSALRDIKPANVTVGNSDKVDGEHASNFSYTHQSSFDFSKIKSGRIVTFDQLGTDYGWINGFASTHNNYLTSVLFNTHRTSNWYVGYIEGNMSTGKTDGLLAVHKLAFVDLIPTSLKNPHALTISLNGTSQGPYDGSAAKNINITPSSIGAAVSNHSHDYLVVNAADDKSFNSAYHNFLVLYAGGGNGITGKPANVDAFGLFKFRTAIGWSGQMLLANGGSLYIRSSEDALMTNTLAWKTILDSSNYSSTLDSRYYTESEVNNLLNAKLNRQNLSYGTWNPRGYNLAADYSYNGGDLSISENDGKIYVSIDGLFYQNEGLYRVLDTSDVAGLKNNLTVHLYLSNTDTTWYPLILGGSSHNNTSDSTGTVYKSYGKLSWLTSSLTLYATKLLSESLTTGSALFVPGTIKDATLKIYSGRTTDAVDDGHIGLLTSIDSTDGETHTHPTNYGSRCVLALLPRGGSVYIGNMPNGGNGRKLNVNGDIGLFNVGSIRDLTIGGGIYWNPYVESTTDSSDAASITVVRLGVAGGTTLVLSLMNDANDTILFKTNGSARLYHNSYPILTTLNTYVSNNKGYINGTEITLVNNADMLDGYHLSTLVNKSGENLIIGTTHASTIGWNQNGWSGGISTYDENNGVYKIWSTSGWHTLYYTLDSQYASKSISFSFDIMFISSESTEGPVGVYVGSSNSYIGGTTNYIPSNSDLWEHKQGKITLGSTPYFGIMIRGTDNSGKSCFYRIKNLKVELGDLPTIWTPAHADITWNNLTGKPSSFIPSAHTHPYLPLSGGTMTGVIKSVFESGTWINGVTNAIIKGEYTKYGAILSIPVKNGRISLSSFPANDNNIYFGYATTLQINAGTNDFNKCMYWDAPNNNLHADIFTGTLAGNAFTATKLQTPRSIWGQSFDGTANVSGFMKNVKGLIHGNSINEDWSDGNNTHPWYGIDYRHCVDSSEIGKAYTSISSFFGLYFKTGGCRFIFDGGDVGIGTASPIEKLDVHGNIISNNIRIYGNEVTNNSKGLFIQASDKTNRAFLTYNGNVENTSYLNICSEFGNIVLSPSRNVGIGTTTPAYKLDVNGTLGVTSTASFGSTIYLPSFGDSYIGKGSGDKSGADFTEANIVIRSLWGISFKSYDDIVRTYIDTRTGNIGTKGKFIGNLNGIADSANKLNKWFDSRVTTLNHLFGDGALRIFHATSSVTDTTKCPSDATILHLAWDNNEGWDSLLAVGPSHNTLYFRGLNNYKWNLWQTVLHNGNSSISGNTIKINNTSLTVANYNHTHDDRYLKLEGGTMLDLSRISVNGDLYIGDVYNNGYLYFQDIASLDGVDYWYISTDGSAEFEDISTRSSISIGGLIYRGGIDSSWNKGRDNALVRDTSSNGYHPLWSLKTTNGSWEFGEYNNPNWYDVPVLSYITDSNYNSGNNVTTYQIKFPLASGTVALTSNIPNPTDYYWANIKISSTDNIMTLPLFYSVKAYQYSLTNTNGSGSYNLAYLYNNIINIGSNSLVMHINASNILFYANSTLCVDINTQGHIGIGKTASLSALLTVASITELTTLKLLVDGTFRLQPVCVACGKVIDPISSTNLNVYSSLNITATYTNNHYRINLDNLKSSMLSQNNVYAQITPITKYVSYRTEAIKDGSYIYLDVYCNARTSFYFCVWAY